MKKIPLTQGKGALVDAQDYPWLNQWKWYALKQPNTYYACRDIREDGKRKTIWMHRLINGTPTSMKTDHIDCNGLNNRRTNLRTVTHQQNMVNNRRHKRGSSRYRGASWHIRQNRWIAQITVNRKNIYVGRFVTERAAYKAYLAVRAVHRAGQIIKR